MKAVPESGAIAMSEIKRMKAVKIFQINESGLDAEVNTEFVMSKGQLVISVAAEDAEVVKNFLSQQPKPRISSIGYKCELVDNEEESDRDES